MANALGKQQNMWLSTPGGKDYLKCHFSAHTESQESAWLPGSQALSLLPVFVSPKHGKWHFGAKKVLGYLQKCLAKIRLSYDGQSKHTVCTNNLLKGNKEVEWLPILLTVPGSQGIWRSRCLGWLTHHKSWDDLVMDDKRLLMASGWQTGHKENDIQRNGHTQSSMLQEVGILLRSF